MSDQIPHWLFHQAQVQPSKTALFFNGQKWSYQQLAEQSVQMAVRFREYGIQAGDHVGILSKNSPVQVQTFLALSLIGAVIIPLKWRLRTPELAFQIQEAQCQQVILQDDLQAAIPKDISCIPFSMVSQQVDGVNADSYTDKNISLKETLAIFFTSGTTGNPKGVELTYRNFLFSALANALNMGVLENDLWLGCLPLDHIGGFSILTRSFIYGTSVMLQEQFETKQTLELLQTKPITLVSLVPTMLRRLLEAGLDVHDTSLRAILLGGAAPQPDLITDALKRDLPVVRSYGMTETCSQAVATPINSLNENNHSSGKPLAFTQIKIADDDGNAIEVGTTGEILLKGPTLMSGYWNNPVATNESIDSQGWFHTGDFGYLDEQKNLYTVSRRENLIITGGENVYPEEVESVLNAHPSIIDSCVFGIEDNEWGHIVIAAIQVSQNTDPDFNEIKRFLSKRLARFKLPKDYLIVTNLPRTTSGKIKRAVIKKRYLSIK